MSKQDNFFSRNRWSLFVLVIFITIVVQHVSGIWYNTESMEDSDSLTPLFIYFPQLVIMFGIIVWRWKSRE